MENIPAPARSAGPTLAIDLSGLDVEVLCPIANGTIVRLPDGSIGEQTWGDSVESHVIHSDRILGRGPWIFERWQVEPATPEERAAYIDRVVGLLRTAAV